MTNSNASRSGDAIVSGSGDAIVSVGPVDVGCWELYIAIDGLKDVDPSML